MSVEAIMRRISGNREILGKSTLRETLQEDRQLVGKLEGDNLRKTQVNEQVRKVRAMKLRSAISEFQVTDNGKRLTELIEKLKDPKFVTRENMLPLQEAIVDFLASTMMSKIATYQDIFFAITEWVAPMALVFRMVEDGEEISKLLWDEFFSVANQLVRGKLVEADDLEGAKDKESDIKYPEIRVKLVGTDGNAFALMGKVAAALRKAGVSKEEIAAFYKEATSGDYGNLLRTCSKWVDVH